MPPARVTYQTQARANIVLLVAHVPPRILKTRRHFALLNLYVTVMTIITVMVVHHDALDAAGMACASMGSMVEGAGEA